MLQRAKRLAQAIPRLVREELREVQQIVQSTLEKVRSLSQALHPVMLEEMGFESALDDYLPGFESRTGIAVHVTKAGWRGELNRRGFDPSLSRAAGSAQQRGAPFRLELRRVCGCSPTEAWLTLEIEDHGSGFGDRSSSGAGHDLHA